MSETRECQKRAVKNYRKRQKEKGLLKYIQLEFNEPEMDLYRYLQQHKPVRTYIKQLIRKDMERNTNCEY